MPENNTPTSKRNTRSVTNNQPLFTLADIEQLISKAKKEMLSSFKDEMRKISSSIDVLSSKIVNFEKRLSVLQAKSDEHENQIIEIRQVVGTLQSDFTHEVTEEMEQRTQRLQNIVISGISELGNGSVDDRKHHDEKETELVLSELGISNLQHYHISRIGKPHQNRSRMIKVVCPDVQTKRTILRNGKRLRSSPHFKNVFVNEDRTPMQQDQFRKLRAELKRRKENGEDVMIRHNKIMTRHEIENFR